MEWSIQEVARLAGTTSRTLRHYDDIGLLAPSSVGSNGYRRYDEAALVRLQRILLLRQLGLGLSDIADVLARQADEQEALETHLALLRQEQGRLTRQIAAVASTIEVLRGGEQLMAQDMFDGFDHTQYESEVVERWGSDAYAQSDTWWRGLDADERAQWQRETSRLGADWTDAATRGIPPESDEAQQLAARHIAWLTGVPGAPTAPDQLKGYVTGLGEMYVADARFAANYGGQPGAELVRDALRVYAQRTL
ncbi:MerR family transcriptional regulator [Microbacterium sp. zg.Y625]|uniref:MerR family transcriptional regulator n=1 Tax=Microbacterium jiangjiandongii TaxID=3049071 RepID=UPI00214C6C8F|nr:MULTISPECIES: MerR family transcriptional regulator [unclassified Microbacterium]MCR2794132.1 MerR family transcriptional regulator [Microbacterium sp. zg.Y625]WIM25573.1 MerR family transcriptional regulator [Microbacterium sp. zg-Y625]